VWFLKWPLVVTLAKVEENEDSSPREGTKSLRKKARWHHQSPWVTTVDSSLSNFPGQVWVPVFVPKLKLVFYH
jgi:hypothetical protein